VKKNNLSEEGVHMDTNAYLLDQKKIDLLKKNGLRYVLVTLDGTKNVHNKRRVCPTVSNTFDKIVENIILMAKIGIHVSVFTPIDTENIDDLIPLMDFLNRKLGYEKKSIVLYFRTVENNDVFKERLSRVLYGKEPFLNKKIVDAFVHVRSLGFKYMTRASSYQCSRYMKYNLIVGPQGEIYKCAGVTGIKKQTVGTIYDDVHKVLKNVDDYISVSGVKKKCKYCVVLPHCAGGCQFQSVMKTGKAGRMICEKKGLLALYQEQLKNNIA
jgi:uncharacterized protein